MELNDKRSLFAKPVSSLCLVLFYHKTRDIFENFEKEEKIMHECQKKDIFFIDLAAGEKKYE